MDFWKTFKVVGLVLVTALLAVAAFIYGTSSPEPATPALDDNSPAVSAQPQAPASNNGGAQFF